MEMRRKLESMRVTYMFIHMGLMAILMGRLIPIPPRHSFFGTELYQRF